MIITVILITWAPLLLLSVFAGRGSSGDATQLVIHDHGVTARLLICVPVFLLAEGWITHRLQKVVNYLWNTEILPDSQREAFKDECRKLNQRRDSLPLNIALLVVSYATVALIISAMVQHATTSWYFSGDFGLKGITPAGWWYALISLPIWTFLFLWWLWQIGIWWNFLGKVSAMNLSLIPTHPDRVGGLGMLQAGQVVFSAIGFGLSAILSASLSNSIRNEGATLITLAPTIGVYVSVALFMIIGPLLAFIPMLIRTKHGGMAEYGDLGDELSRAFHEKWIPIDGRDQRKLLDSADPSAVGDFGACYDAIAQMRMLPFGRTAFLRAMLMLLLPLSPLLLINYSWREIVQDLIRILG